MRSCKGIFIAVLLAETARAGLGAVGTFVDVSDVGAVSRTTEATYEDATGTYTVGASGDNMWGARDAFGFVWKPTVGDVALAARIEMQGESAQDHRKAGLMLRQSLAPDSAYVDVVIHGDGLTSLQFRSEAGGPTREVQCASQAPSAVRLEKRGDYVLLQLENVSGRFEASGCTIKLALKGTFYAGLVVCAHDNNAFEVVRFRRVSLGLLPKRSETRVSAIELIPLGSLDRKVIYRSPLHLDSPSFTANGKAICFREDGRLHVLSLSPGADARTVGEQNAEECVTALTTTASPWQVTHEIKSGRAQVFRRGGGNPKPLQLTKDQFSNWTPRLSPAGTMIAFISGSEPPEGGKPVAGDYLLREIPVDGANQGEQPRELARFYGGPGSLGPAPWSADGKQLVFVSREPE
jgi:hypothetical protein